MKKIFSLLLILFSLQNYSFSQDQQLIDSLLLLLKNHHAQKTELQIKSQSLYDSTAANILSSLSIAHFGNNPEKAMDYANQSLTLSEQIGYKKGLGDAYNNIAIVNSIQGNYLQALEFHKKALKIREEIGDKTGIAGSYNNIGIINWYQGNYPEALKNYSEALKIKKELGDKKGSATSYNNIGIIYMNQGNYPEALKNYFEALKIQEEIGNKMGISSSYNNIGLTYMNQGNFSESLKNHFAALKIREEIGDKKGIAASYNNIGDTYTKQGNFSEALKNNFAALKIEEEIGDKNSIALSYHNIGSIHADQGNFSEALKNHFAALKIREEIGDKNGVAASCINIGNIYTKEKKYNDASHYLNRGLALSKEIGSLDNIKSSYAGLAELGSAEGNFKKALEHYKLFITTRDSLFNEENTRKTVQQQMQYDFDKKESQTKAEQEKKDAIALKELQKQKLVRNGFVGGFAVVLFFAGVFFRQRNKIKTGKKRSDELLLNILPIEVAEELKTKGSADAKYFDDVTVMFTDFKNFTQISEKLSPTELVNEIHTCFKSFDDIIGKHNIEKIKTIGDAYMCAGGLPVANTTNATDVLNAAIEIQQFMKQHLQQRKNDGKEVFEIRIGIHTGPVVAGIVGVKKFAYDIWGDTVNIASRMESSGEAGKINISGNTYELVKDKFTCTHRGKIQAKNKGEIDMYFVESIL